MPSPREEEEVEWPEDRAARPHSSPISPYVTLDKVLLCQTFISRSRQGGLLFVSDLDERPYSTYGGKKKKKQTKKSHAAPRGTAQKPYCQSMGTDYL